LNEQKILILTKREREEDLHLSLIYINWSVLVFMYFSIYLLNNFEHNKRT